MSSVLTLLFAPSFLILTHFFQFKLIVLIYILLSLLFLIYAYIKKEKYENLIIVTIYLLLLSIAFVDSSIGAVKLIPVFTAMVFFAIFVHSAVYKKELIFKFTKKIIHNEMSEAETLFLKNGDTFWAVAVFLYITILIGITFYGDDTLWAFFSSIGWYIYFFTVLLIQIIYGKMYAIKLYS